LVLGVAHWKVNGQEWATAHTFGYRKTCLDSKFEFIGFSDITCSAEYIHNKKPSIESGLVTFEATRK